MKLTTDDCKICVKFYEIALIPDSDLFRNFNRRVINFVHTHLHSYSCTVRNSTNDQTVRKYRTYHSTCGVVSGRNIFKSLDESFFRTPIIRDTYLLLRICAKICVFHSRKLSITLTEPIINPSSLLRSLLFSQGKISVNNLFLNISRIDDTVQ